MTFPFNNKASKRDESSVFRKNPGKNKFQHINFQVFIHNCIATKMTIDVTKLNGGFY